MDADAPLLDGPVIVNTDAPLPRAAPRSGAESQVVVMPAANFQALATPFGPTSNVRGIVAPPLDVDILLLGAWCPDPIFCDHFLPVPVTLTFFFGQETLGQLGITPGNLQIYHYQRNTGQWVNVPIMDINPELGWISTQPINEDGIFAVVWVGE